MQDRVGKPQDPYVKTRDIMVVLLFCLVMRALVEILASNFLVADGYYVALVADCLMYGLMGAILWLLISRSTLDIKQIFGPPIGRVEWLQAVSLALIVLAFTLGENAVEVLIAAKTNLEWTYSFWNFHPASLHAYSMVSPRVLLYMVVNVFLAPALEEFVFRGLLLRTLASRLGLWTAMLTGSGLFTVLHFGSHYYLSTFVFSVVLYFVYIRRGSLVPCIVMHGAFNLFAFIHQYYFDIQWTRSIDSISSIGDWRPQLAMFACSLLILGYLALRHARPIVRSSI